MSSIFNWGKRKDEPEPVEILKQIKKSSFPQIYVAGGHIPLVANTATYHVFVSVISGIADIDESLITPKIGLDSKLIQLPTQEPDDADCWQDLLSKPWTHLVEFFYVTKKGEKKYLFYHPLNCYLTYHQSDYVATQIAAKGIVGSALLETNPRCLLDGFEVRVIGVWLISAFAVYKRLWVDSRKRIGWGG